MSKFSDNLDKLDLVLADFFDDSLSIGERRLFNTLVMIYSLIRAEYTRCHQFDK